MKILMLTLYLPYPANSGGQIRSYNLIKHLSKKHQITLVSFIKKGEEKFVAEMKKYCKEVLFFYRSDNPWTIKNILKTGFSPYPFLVMRNFSSEGKEALKNKINQEKYDLIHVETFYLMPHVPKTTIPILLVDQTIEFQVYQHYVDTMRKWLLRPLFYIDVFKLKYWETKFWRQATKVVAVSEMDGKVMREYVLLRDVSVIPNAPGDDLSDLFNKRKKAKLDEPVIFFQGNFLWLQNIQGAEVLAKNVFPIIKKTLPKAICFIAGQNASKIASLANLGVEILPLASDDVEGVKRAYLRGTVFVAPLWGPGGTQLKILSAMSTGIPVVTTPVRASGIDVTDGKEVLIGRSPDDLAQKTVNLLTNKTLYDSIIKNARQLIIKKYNWIAISEKLSKLYEETARKN